MNHSPGHGSTPWLAVASHPPARPGDPQGGGLALGLFSRLPGEGAKVSFKPLTLKCPKAGQRLETTCRMLLDVYCVNVCISGCCSSDNFANRRYLQLERIVKDKLVLLMNQNTFSITKRRPGGKIKQ